MRAIRILRGLIGTPMERMNHGALCPINLDRGKSKVKVGICCTPDHSAEVHMSRSFGQIRASRFSCWVLRGGETRPSSAVGSAVVRCAGHSDKTQRRAVFPRMIGKKRGTAGSLGRALELRIRRVSHLGARVRFSTKRMNYGALCPINLDWALLHV